MPGSESRQAVSIPVHRDKRSLEQKHRDLVVNLLRSNRQPPNELTHWIDSTNRLWSDVMRRMRQNAFVLAPSDSRDLDPLSTLDSMAQMQSIFSRMDRQIQALRKQMTQSPPAQPAFGMLSYDNSRDDLFGPIVPEGGLRGGLLGFLKDAFQMGADGKIRFHLQFDVRGYEPEHIQVRREKHWLTVHAKKNVRTTDGRGSSEYCRTVYIPDSVDSEHFECLLTDDGVLVLEAPIKHKDEVAVKFDRDLQLGIKPPLEKPKSVDGKCMDLQVTGKVGPVVKTDGDKKCLHVEFPVEPGFTADDLSVRVDANRLIVTGRREVNEDTDTFKGSCIREFTRSYSVPETVDPFSIKVQVHGNTVVLETPLVQVQ